MGDSKGKGKGERINAQFSSMPATECIGAGRLDGWFATGAYQADARGWGHIRSYCFEGDLFFHLQRSPLLRGINFQKKDPVTFEVVEVNGRVEAVKLLEPKQVDDLEKHAHLGDGDNEDEKPSAKDFLGQRVEGNVKSQYQLVAKQHWGFVGSDSFAGQVFWHITENPDMEGEKYEREDFVEFEVWIDATRGDQVRAKNMKFLKRNEKNDKPKAGHLSDSKIQKRAQWKANWRAAPPPDWACKLCGFQNFGRNKYCKQCEEGARPPREEWPADDDADPASKMVTGMTPHAMPPIVNEPTWENVQDGDWICASCGNHNFRSRDTCNMCGAPKASVTVFGASGSSTFPVVANSAAGAEVVAPPRVPDLSQALAEPSELMKEQQRLQQLQEQIQLQQQMAQQPEQQQQMQLPGGRGGGDMPLRRFPADGSVQTTLALCMGAFNDLVSSSDSQEKILDDARGAIWEVNQVLGEDKSAKHSFSMQLAKHPWFAQNGMEVRYKPGKNCIEISASAQALQDMSKKRKLE